MEAVLNEARETFESGKTKSLSWRRAQLSALLLMLQEAEDNILQVLREDLGKHRNEAYRDEVCVNMCCKHTCMLHLHPIQCQSSLNPHFI